MKKVYFLLVLIILAVIILNAAVLYIALTRPSTMQVQQMIDTSINRKLSASTESDLSKALAEILPTLPKVEKGDPGQSIVGAQGPAGKDGQSITGPAGPKGDSVVGPKGDTGASGREIELAKDPSTGDLYMRYTGDTAWTLVQMVVSR